MKSGGEGDALMDSHGNDGVVAAVNPECEHRWRVQSVHREHALYVCRRCGFGLNVDHPVGTSGVAGLLYGLNAAGALLTLLAAAALWAFLGGIAALAAGAATWFFVSPLIVHAGLLRYQGTLINYTADRAKELRIDPKGPRKNNFLEAAAVSQ